MNSLQIIWALVKKDVLLEVRQQHSFYGVLLYVVSTIFVLFLAMGSPEPDVWNGLFWMIQLFVCINAVAKSFLQESRGRMLYFYSIAGPRDFVLAKLLFNSTSCYESASILNSFHFSFVFSSVIIRQSSTVKSTGR